ncbi:DUF1998 domain-containing protein [Microbacterium aurum]
MLGHRYEKIVGCSGAPGGIDEGVNDRRARTSFWRCGADAPHVGLDIVLAKNIDGSVTGAIHRMRHVELVIMDTVPGGAGYATLVAEQLEIVLRKGLEIVATCECGPETSDSCLRTYSNQKMARRVVSRRCRDVSGEDAWVTGVGHVRGTRRRRPGGPHPSLVGNLSRHGTIRQ